MEQQGISKLDLKRQNRMQILRILKKQGPTSRIDISASLELTRAAVTIITNEMISQGILAEVGEVQYTNEKTPKGRKKILIDIDQHYKFVMGACIEDTGISCGLTTLYGEVMDKQFTPISEADTPEKAARFIGSCFRQFLDNNCLSEDDVIGAGVGVQPLMRDIAGVPVISGKADYSMLETALQEYVEIPMIFGSSSVLAAMAHIDFTMNRPISFERMAFIQCSHEYSLVVAGSSGEIISREDFESGIGSIIVNLNAEPSQFAAKGTVGAELTPEGVCEKAKRIYSPERTPELYKLTGGDVGKISYDLVSQAAFAGDRDIMAIRDDMLRRMVVLINNVVCTYGPTKTVLDKMFITSYEKQLLLDTIKEVAGDNVAKNVEVVSADPRYSFLGGCAYAVRELFIVKGGHCSKTVN